MARGEMLAMEGRYMDHPLYHSSSNIRLANERISKLNPQVPVSNLAPILNKMRSVKSRSEEHTSELQSQSNIVCRLLLEKKQDIALAEDRGALAVVGWGSTFGAIHEAVLRARGEGLAVSHIHVRYLSPFPLNLRELLPRS